MIFLMCLVASVWVLPRWFGRDVADASLAARADSTLPLSKSPLSKSGLLESAGPFQVRGGPAEKIRIRKD